MLKWILVGLYFVGAVWYVIRSNKQGKEILSYYKSVSDAEIGYWWLSYVGLAIAGVFWVPYVIMEGLTKIQTAHFIKLMDK